MWPCRQHDQSEHPQALPMRPSRNSLLAVAAPSFISPAGVVRLGEGLCKFALLKLAFLYHVRAMNKGFATICPCIVTARAATVRILNVGLQQQPQKTREACSLLRTPLCVCHAVASHLNQRQPLPFGCPSISFRHVVIVGITKNKNICPVKASHSRNSHLPQLQSRTGDTLPDLGANRDRGVPIARIRRWSIRLFST